jgi:hypothetical protein
MTPRAQRVIEKAAVAMIMDTPSDIWKRAAIDGQHGAYKELARAALIAALEEMMEPTLAMEWAGRDANEKYDGEPGSCASFRGVDAWQAMLSTLLSDLKGA